MVMPAGPAKPASPVTIADLKQKRKDGKLVGFRCANKHTWVTPVARCPTCSKTVEQVELPGEGTVVTFTIQNVAAEEFLNETPFAWAIVQLTDGTKVTGWIPYIATDRDLKIGDRVKFTPTYKPGVMFEKA
jgi:uncharacterized OB-fold protein